MAPSGYTNGLNYANEHHGDDSTVSAATKLRRIIEDPNGFLMCPGVYDGFSARIALEVGFEGIYMVGFLPLEYGMKAYTSLSRPAQEPQHPALVMPT